MQLRPSPATRRRGARLLLLAGALAAGLPVTAAVLPEDRADLLYHRYEGGGVTVDGPSLLVRKSVGNDVSVEGNYYVDMVTSASIDVVTTASPYSEQRKEKTVSVDYLHADSILTGSYTRSDESDYTANTGTFGVSQDFFGGLSTLSMTYQRGWDTVRNNEDPDFEAHTTRQSYKVGLTQVLTKDLLANLTYEGITDQGYLHNPYRSVRYVDPSVGRGYSYQGEVYPKTHTSQAIALRGKYHLPWRDAVSAEYRFYDDTWGVTAHTVDLGYTHSIGERWLLDLDYRFYTQTHADFYSDLFPRVDAQNFLARDKELSTFTSHSLGLGATYQFFKSQDSFFKKGSASLFVDFMHFRYDDFRDLRDTGAPVGEEPEYGFDAQVYRLFMSVRY